jgi:hypothetical protein
MDQRKPGRKAAPGSAKKGYFFRNGVEVLMRYSSPFTGRT